MLNLNDQQEIQAQTQSKTFTDEITGSYMKSPTSIVGKRFKFNDTNDHDVWEVSDILFDKNGWSSLTIEQHHPVEDGDSQSKQTQKFKFDVFISLLKHRVLNAE